MRTERTDADPRARPDVTGVHVAQGRIALGARHTRHRKRHVFLGHVPDGDVRVAIVRTGVKPAVTFPLHHVEPFEIVGKRHAAVAVDRRGRVRHGQMEVDERFAHARHAEDVSTARLVAREATDDATHLERHDRLPDRANEAQHVRGVAERLVHERDVRPGTDHIADVLVEDAHQRLLVSEHAHALVKPKLDRRVATNVVQTTIDHSRLDRTFLVEKKNDAVKTHDTSSE